MPEVHFQILFQHLRGEGIQGVDQFLFLIVVAE